ncbi:MAG: alpha/beta fold hydrolase [Dehalococcoidia bacterium]
MERVVVIAGDDVEPLDPRFDGGITSYLVDGDIGPIAYRRFGEETAPAVVITHAVPLSSLAWVNVMPYFADYGLQVFALDLPGSGGTQPAASPLDLDGYARALEAFVDAIGFDVVHLVGHATHAATALRFSVRHPGRVRRLVLSKTPFLDEASRRRFAGTDPGLYRADLPFPSREHWSPVPQLDDDRFDLLVRRMRFDIGRAGPRWIEGYQALAEYDLEADLRRLRIPCRLVWGELDQFVAHRDAMVEAAGNVEVAIVAGASAWPMYERPRGWTAAVAEFLTSPVGSFAAGSA